MALVFTYFWCIFGTIIDFVFVIEVVIIIFDLYKIITKFLFHIVAF